MYNNHKLRLIYCNTIHMGIRWVDLVGGNGGISLATLGSFKGIRKESGQRDSIGDDGDLHQSLSATWEVSRKGRDCFIPCGNPGRHTSLQPHHPRNRYRPSFRYRRQPCGSAQSQPRGLHGTPP